MTLDEEIGRRLAEAAASGELEAAPSYGKPLQGMEGWDETPEPLRMAFKILKDAGYAPPELAMFHERARLRAARDAAGGPGERRQLQQRLAELEQALSLRLEALRMNGNI